MHEHPRMPALDMTPGCGASCPAPADGPGVPFVRIDPRVKLVVALVFCVSVVTTPFEAAGLLAAYAALLLIAVLINFRVLRDTAGRIARALPILAVLVVLIPLFKPGRPVWQWGFLGVSAEGLETAGMIFACGLLCVGAFAVVAATTPEARLLEGLRGIGVPAMLVAVIGLMLRYLHLLRSELHRLRDARDARTIGAGGPHPIRSGANLLGSLFLRSFDRAQRVADAMAARGYEGRLQVFHRHRAGPAEVVVGAAVTAFLVAIRVWGPAVHG